VGDEGGFANLASGTEDARHYQKKQLKMRLYFW
jgi:hypothetical protein